MIDLPHLEGYEIGRVYDIRLPTYVNVSKKTQKACNLNVYRNLHHHHLNSQKKNFDDEVAPLLRGLPKLDKIAIHYEIFAPRNGRLDTMNVGSIVDKYFSDTLVHAGKLKDDHYGHILNVSFSFGGVQKMDGHAIATIYELVSEEEHEKEEEPMRILLDEQDIQEALDAYVAHIGIAGATGVTLTGDNIEAEVQIGEPAEKPKNKGGRPKGSRNKPKPPVEETPDVETDADAGSNGTDSGGSESPQESPAEVSEPVKETKSANPSKTEEAKNSSSIFGEEEEATNSVPPAKAVKSGASIFDD